MLKLTQRVDAIRQIGRVGKVDQMASVNGKAQLLPRGTIVMAMILAAMFAVPFILRTVNKVMDSRRVEGRGAGGVAGGSRVLQTRSGVGAGTSLGGTSEVLSEGQYRIFYAPDENLEREDVQVLDSARSAIDAALYSATDVELCSAIAQAARRGVKVRVYRDREQYTDEETRAHGRATCSAELVASGAEVKVKASQDLMHMKSYAVDGRLLRTGSANLSASGEKHQDNDAVFLASAVAVRGFESQFERIWARDSNERVTSTR
jgi:phosphatidylserine/phosphatidylglycerophosphate/cardiolipin synthase-like enzyme